MDLLFCEEGSKENRDSEGVSHDLGREALAMVCYREIKGTAIWVGDGADLESRCSGRDAREKSGNGETFFFFVAATHDAEEAPIVGVKREKKGESRCGCGCVCVGHLPKEEEIAMRNPKRSQA